MQKYASLRILFFLNPPDNFIIPKARTLCARPKPNKKMNLLIVEDNASMRRLIKSIVFDLAEEIEECGDGADVLAAYEKHLPEWVLMDVKMPRTDGITASHRLLARYPQAKICIVTECADAKTRQAASDAGVREYVLKDDLINIRSIIGKKNETANSTLLGKPI